MTAFMFASKQSIFLKQWGQGRWEQDHHWGPRASIVGPKPQNLVLRPALRKLWHLGITGHMLCNITHNFFGFTLSLHIYAGSLHCSMVPVWLVWSI